MIFKKIYILLFVIVLGLLAVMNYKFYNSFNQNNAEECLSQLNFLKGEIHKDAGERMQRFYPEGYLYTNVLYGLAWCEYANNNINNKPLLYKALHEADFALANIESNKCKDAFPYGLSPEYGIFYQSWTNYLRGQIILLKCRNVRDTVLVNNFIKGCKAIDSALINSKSPFLQTYHNEAWPADMMPGIASLKIYDELFSPAYTTTIDNFMSNIKQRLDHRTALIPHSVDAENGYANESARGSSQSLILRFLAEIDPDFAYYQYRNFSNLFINRKLGFTTVREYPDFINKKSDVNSGPVVFGEGSAATINAIAAARAMGDTITAVNLIATVEASGLPINSNKNKRYLFGRLPLADAFIIWARLTPVYNKNIPLSDANYNKTLFHVYSSAVIIVMILPLILFKKRRVEEDDDYEEDEEEDDDERD